MIRFRRRNIAWFIAGKTGIPMHHQISTVFTLYDTYTGVRFDNTCGLRTV